MSRKSKRLSEAVRPVIEQLQPRMLLSGEMSERLLAPTSPNLVGIRGDALHIPFWEPVPVNHNSDPSVPSSSPGGMVVEGGKATLYGTDGDDTIVVTPGEAAGEIRVSGITGVADGTLFSGINTLTIRGGSGNDRITVDSGQVWSDVYGGDGDDVLIATGRADNLHGGRGNDLIAGSIQDQNLDDGPGNDTIDGGGGIDSLYVGWPCLPEDPSSGHGEDATSGVVVRMDLGTVPNDGFGGQDIIANIRDVYVGSPLNDVVYGDDQDNRIVCSDNSCRYGSDTIYGGGGDDWIGISKASGLLSGGDGNDTLFALSVDSVDVIMDGGAGQDTYSTHIAGEDWSAADEPASDEVQSMPTIPAANENGGAAPEAVWVAPRQKLADSKVARKAHVAAKSKAAKVKAAKLEARQAKLGKLIRQ